MDINVYKKYEKILNTYKLEGRVLEIGAMANERSLLNINCLNDLDKVGISLDGPKKYRDFKIDYGNANYMPQFKKSEFDLVLCNAVIEHDKEFWKTLNEIRRVVKKNGLVIIGAPGFARNRNILNICKIPILNKINLIDVICKSTIVYKLHEAPKDYYRFSEDAFRDVIMDGYESVQIVKILFPPRIIGIGKNKK